MWDSGRSKLEWFQTFLELPNGVPSHDHLRHARLQSSSICFMAWTQAIAELLPGEVVAIDGKTARRSYDRAGSPGHASDVSIKRRLEHPDPGAGQDGGSPIEITAIINC